MLQVQNLLGSHKTYQKSNFATNPFQFSSLIAKPTSQFSISINSQQQSFSVHHARRRRRPRATVTDGASHPIRQIQAGPTPRSRRVREGLPRPEPGEWRKRSSEDDKQEEVTIFFVMEFVEGGELFSKIAKGRFSENLSRRYFHQLISAVGYCHSRGVFHRDLKPENLLIDDNGDLKIHPDGLLHTLCGTPAYVAPEILGKRGYDGAKVDVWSCGIILFILNAGYLPSTTQT